MSLACLACRAENRDGAKFCRGCGRRLVTLSPTASVPSPREEWPATQRISLGNHAATLTPAPDVRSPAPKARPAVARSAPVAKSKLLRFGAIGFMLLAGISGVGGWYAQRERAPEPPQVAPLRETPGPAPSAVTPPAAAPAAVAPQAALAPAAVEPAPTAVAANAVPAPQKPRKTAPVVATPVPAPAIVAVPAPPPVPAAAPEPAAPANPQATCAGLNFFARAQCMAAQCARPEHRATAQCEAVRRQQQIDEEKRNPTLMN